MAAAASSSITSTTGWAAVVDVGAVHNGNISDFNLDSTFINFLAGPRFSIRRSKRVTPYFQALFGGVYADIQRTGYRITDCNIRWTPGCPGDSGPAGHRPASTRRRQSSP